MFVEKNATLLTAEMLLSQEAKDVVGMKTNVRAYKTLRVRNSVLCQTLLLQDRTPLRHQDQRRPLDQNLLPVFLKLATPFYLPQVAHAKLVVATTELP